MKRKKQERKGINVRDEKEFKLWIKLICSIQKEGGDISNPINILWNSIKEEIEITEKECRLKDRIFQS